MLHTDRYRENIAEIERLLAIHEILTGVERSSIRVSSSEFSPVLVMP